MEFSVNELEVPEIVQNVIFHVTGVNCRSLDQASPMLDSCRYYSQYHNVETILSNYRNTFSSVFLLLVQTYTW